MTIARFRCPQCGVDLLDPETKLEGLTPDMVGALLMAHDDAEHGGQQSDTAYAAIVAQVAKLQRGTS